MFQLGIINDEVSADFEEACRHIRDWGLDLVELRTLWGKNILELSEDKLAEAEKTLTQYDLKVTAIASPVFKSPRDGQPVAASGDFQLSGHESIEAQLELLEHACTLANRFNTDYVRIFSFWREPWSNEIAEDVADKLIQAAEVARGYEVTLAVENEPVCIVGTGQELGDLFRLIEQKNPAALDNLGALWDPGNALCGGEAIPYPDGYRALDIDTLVHVHLKDPILEGDTCRFVPLGEGELPYVDQFKQLQADGYKGVVVLEPHYQPGGEASPEAAERCVKAAQQVLAKARKNT